MEVIGNKGKSTDPYRIERLRPGEGSQDDGIEGRPGPKEEAALERPAGHFDQGAWGRDEAELSTHAKR